MSELSTDGDVVWSSRCKGEGRSYIDDVKFETRASTTER